jgi:dTDP-4-dehydrorhamnose 3,5-epimerase
LHRPVSFRRQFGSRSVKRLAWPAVQVRELDIEGSWEFTPPAFPDNRGRFAAPFQGEAFVTAVGHPLRLAQTNHSVSRRGVIRGVHFADVPPGQAKYVYCPTGALLDVIVDVRVGSPTFGQWTAVRLDAEKLNAVYLSEGLGHAFVALADDTAMAYICSEGYNPGGERGISPVDPALGLPWPSDIEPILSDKDRDAPTLAEAEAAGLLPVYADCLAYRAKLS